MSPCTAAKSESPKVPVPAEAKQGDTAFLSYPLSGYKQGPLPGLSSATFFLHFVLSLGDFFAHYLSAT